LTTNSGPSYRSPALDILVPTRDRPLRLAAMLASLSAQEFPSGCDQAALYLLDNGQTSAFADFDVARQLDVLEWRGLRTFYLRRPHLRGIFSIRRQLYEIASGDIVCYLDDDVLLGPGTIRRLWHGLQDRRFALTASFVVDVDQRHEGEIGYHADLAATTAELAAQVGDGGIAMVDGPWMEMVSPFGTNLMFRRSDFDAVGAWEAMAPCFGDDPSIGGEDVGLCVSLKSRGEAFVDIADVVLHFTPARRTFASFDIPQALSAMLMERFGADHPAKIPSRLRETGDARPDVGQLTALARRHQAPRALSRG
jgi:glycosyltransferase involved in cell wall biosynthesis